MIRSIYISTQLCLNIYRVPKKSASLPPLTSPSHTTQQPNKLKKNCMYKKIKSPLRAAPPPPHQRGRPRPALSPLGSSLRRTRPLPPRGRLCPGLRQYCHMPSSASAAASPKNSTPAVGARVKLVGFPANNQLNGLQARVLRQDNKGMVFVRVDDLEGFHCKSCTAFTVGVETKNLTLVPSPATASTPE